MPAGAARPRAGSLTVAIFQPFGEVAPCQPCAEGGTAAPGLWAEVLPEHAEMIFGDAMLMTVSWSAPYCGRHAGLCEEWFGRRVTTRVVPHGDHEHHFWGYELTR